jgi:uncharacterized membrane protein YqjE
MIMRAEREIHIRPRAPDGAHNGPVRGPIDRAREEMATLGELFRKLGEDAAALVRDEVNLAKLEVRRDASAIASNLVQVGIAAGLALLGALALTAFLILGLGLLLDGAYWLSALIVGVLFLLVGGLWAKSAIENVKKHAQPPPNTMESLQEDARWARQEAQEFKRQVSA